MATVNDILNEINRIENAKTEIGEAITEKGVDVPAGTPIQGFPALVRSIPTAISELFWCTYGTTPAADIVAALDADKLPIVTHNGRSYIFHSEENGTLYFVTILSAVSYWVSVDESNDAWADFNVTLQDKADKTDDISGNRTSITKYPNTKGVFDLVGKWGVISQTQIWTGSDATGYDYTMSNFVYGMIPQANIDLFVAAGAVFNEATGYFEIANLNDISYNEMLDIYNCWAYVAYSGFQNIDVSNIKVTRTTLPIRASGTTVAMNYRFTNSYIEQVVIGRTPAETQTVSSLMSAFNTMIYLKRVVGIIMTNATAAQSISRAYSLEEISLSGLKSDLSIPNSSALSLSSVVYMVTKSANTTAITITIHATAYARCQSDTTEYIYNGQTYTGVIAYAAAKNITIASA